VILLDACGVVAFFNGEPAAEQVAEILSGVEETAITSLGLAEILDRRVRVGGVDEEEAVLDLAELPFDSVWPVDGSTAQRAGLLRARWYHRRGCQVSMADCVAAAAAQEAGGTLASTDPHLLEACRGENITSLALPDSSGRTRKPRR
jgi:predicted nucleic acid-binding protein